MKALIVIFILNFFTLNIVFAQNNFKIVTSDIDNFWNAYNKITSTRDSTQQYTYLNKFFLDTGTPGLKAIMQVRNYTAKSYIDAINNYPLYWNSIKSNTLKAKRFASEIETGIYELKKLYPELKPATVYFTIGAFRTNGTTLSNMVLIGSEEAFADSNTVTKEFPESLNFLKVFFKSNPIHNVVFGNVHEYVHTQQKNTLGNSLLAQSVLEGVAEFMAVKATGISSTTPAISFGALNNEKVRSVFASQIFNRSAGYWLYSNANNEFGIRDLGYYVGYAICESYYIKASDKKRAIKEMIELDYNDEKALQLFVEQSGYFTEPLSRFKEKYEAGRPTIIGIKELSNHAADVSPVIKTITVVFSTPMNTRARGFDFGPLGENNALKIKRFIGFSEDRKSLSFDVDMKPDFHYQLLLTSRFEDVNGQSLNPYLIDFKTSPK